MVTTLLLTWVAEHATRFLAEGPLHDPAQQGPRTADLLPSAVLPSAEVHGGLFLALGTVALAGAALRWTRAGFQLRAVGLNPDAARAAGIDVERTWTRALLVSGALAGVAGAVEVLAVHHYFQAGFSPGYGYEGIAVAVLGGGSAGGVLTAAILWGGLANGAVDMAVDLRLSSELGRAMVGIVQALVVLAVAVRQWPRIRVRAAGQSRKPTSPT